MSNRQSQEHAVELLDTPAHAHSVAAEAHEKQDHQTGHELSRRAFEHPQKAGEYAGAIHQNGQTFGHEDIAAVAYTHWEAMGRPVGSAEEDWSFATQQLRAQFDSSKLTS